VSSDAASTYATGGGGVTLEHQYTATLLAALLVGDPAPELGDRVALTTVRLQASDVSAVDDLVLEGLDPAGKTHRASIGVRRDPKLATSDTKSAWPALPPGTTASATGEALDGLVSCATRPTWQLRSERGHWRIRCAWP
jgi:hypothetical protein